MERKLSEIVRLGAEYLARYGIDEPLVESEYIISSALNMSRTDLYLKGDEVMGEGTLSKLRRMIMERAVTGKPSPYIIGKKDFYGLEFSVNEECLIPRPETELLVEEVIRAATNVSGGIFAGKKNLNVLDLGCGCGNIAISVAKFVENSFVWAVDISYGAVLKTLENALLNDVYPRVAAYKGDLFSPFASGGGLKYKNFFDIIVSNPPYIPDGDIPSLPREVSSFEPKVALSGGADGIEFYRRIIPAAKFFLSHEGGRIFFEIGKGQRRMVEEILELERYKNITVRNDYNGIERVISAEFRGY